MKQSRGSCLSGGSKSFPYPRLILPECREILPEPRQDAGKNRSYITDITDRHNKQNRRDVLMTKKSGYSKRATMANSEPLRNGTGSTPSVQRSEERRVGKKCR